MKFTLNALRSYRPVGNAHHDADFFSVAHVVFQEGDWKTKKAVLREINRVMGIEAKVVDKDVIDYINTTAN